MNVDIAIEGVLYLSGTVFYLLPTQSRAHLVAVMRSLYGGRVPEPVALFSFLRVPLSLTVVDHVQADGHDPHPHTGTCTAEVG